MLPFGDRKASYGDGNAMKVFAVGIGRGSGLSHGSQWGDLQECMIRVGVPRELRSNVDDCTPIEVRPVGLHYMFATGLTKPYDMPEMDLNGDYLGFDCGMKEAELAEGVKCNGDTLDLDMGQCCGR
ncbi:hypothetical protein NDU88_004807 [Pleurodeles waltl]|uniref:Uncharacterized protein n=1 Tax=Pleurodeles waltl TaxID=8319 RepID=A0AAV7MYL5_PLEWA|nr:hypothetical protein NDU88_004807 [Pleurodeles waltl]